MARPKKEVFSREEVLIIAHAAMSGTLDMAKDSILVAGVEPHPKLGQAIMHLANGAIFHGEAVKNISGQLTLEEGRSAQIQEIIDGLFK